MFFLISQFKGIFIAIQKGKLPRESSLKYPIVLITNYVDYLAPDSQRKLLFIPPTF